MIGFSMEIGATSPPNMKEILAQLSVQLWLLIDHVQREELDVCWAEMEIIKWMVDMTSKNSKIETQKADKPLHSTTT